MNIWKYLSVKLCFYLNTLRFLQPVCSLAVILHCYVGDVAGVMAPFMSTHKSFKRAQNRHLYHRWPLSIEQHTHTLHISCCNSHCEASSFYQSDCDEFYKNVKWHGHLSSWILEMLMLRHDHSEAAVRGWFFWDALWYNVIKSGTGRGRGHFSKLSC